MNDQERSPSHDILLVEYQAAQSSAEHHDNLVWTVTSIIWGASLVILGFIFDKLDDVRLRPVLTVTSVLGITLMLSVWTMALQFNSLKRQKYRRCREIEDKLGMTQHSSLKYAARSQRFIYGGIMLIYIVVWLVVLCVVWSA